MKQLTLIELEVLAHAARGKTVKETAALLHRGLGTVKHHRTAIIDKLDATNIVDAVRIAYDCGLFGATPLSEAVDKPITPTKRDAFHAKCSALDRLRELEPRSTKKRILEEASAEFGRAIESANDFTEGQARIILDRLDAALAAGGAEQATATPDAAAIGASA